MPPSLDNPAVWALTQAKALLWLLVLTRLSGLLAALPGLGQERVPLQVRAALAVLMATIITPVIPGPKALPQSLWDVLAFMVMEFAVGLLLGLLVGWILEAVSMGGYLMDVQMGFSFVQMVDPSTSQTVSVSGVVLVQLSLLFVFLSGLHHQMIQALVESYRIAPLGSGLPGDPQKVVVLLGQMLARGFQLAFPVMLTLFLVDALEGISARFMPQLQLMQLAFPLKIAVGLAVLAVLLRSFAGWLEPLVRAAPIEALRLLG